MSIAATGSWRSNNVEVIATISRTGIRPLKAQARRVSGLAHRTSSRPERVGGHRRGSALGIQTRRRAHRANDRDAQATSPARETVRLAINGKGYFTP